MSRLTEDLHPALSQTTLNKLFKKSIYTALSFVRTSPELLAKTTGINYGEILEIKASILMKFSSKLKNGHKCYQEIINHCAILPSGIENLDKLLDGGFTTGNIYEFCGFAGCGKTQLCMTITVNICMSRKQQVLYIDTKNDISAHRLCEIVESHKIPDVGETMQKIQICHVRSAYNLLKELHKLEEKIRNTKELSFRLIIIDSLSALFQRFSNQSEGLSVLNNVANILKFISVEYHMVVLLTNFVTSWTSDVISSETEKGDNAFQQVQQPALGKYWTHVPNVRVMIKKVDGSNNCFLIVLKSQSQPFGKSVKIRMGDDGVK